MTIQTVGDYTKWHSPSNTSGVNRATFHSLTADGLFDARVGLSLGGMPDSVSMSGTVMNAALPLRVASGNYFPDKIITDCDTAEKHRNRCGPFDERAIEYDARFETHIFESQITSPGKPKNKAE